MWPNRVGKKPSVKADLAIYSHAVDVSRQCMSVSLIPGCKLDSGLVPLRMVFVNPVTIILYEKKMCHLISNNCYQSCYMIRIYLYLHANTVICSRFPQTSFGWLYIILTCE